MFISIVILWFNTQTHTFKHMHQTKFFASYFVAVFQQLLMILVIVNVLLFIYRFILQKSFFFIYNLFRLLYHNVHYPYRYHLKIILVYFCWFCFILFGCDIQFKFITTWVTKFVQSKFSNRMKYLQMKREDKKLVSEVQLTWHLI